MKNKEIEEKISFIRGDILTIEAHTDTLLYILKKDRDVLEKLHSNMDFGELIWGLETFHGRFSNIHEEINYIECYIRELEYKVEKGDDYFE